MKNLQYLWIAALCLTLIGCSRETVNSDVNSTAETAKDTSYIVDETKKGNSLFYHVNDRAYHDYRYRGYRKWK